MRNALFAHCGHNRTFWFDFPSLCFYAAVIENSPWHCFFFCSFSPDQDEFYQQLQAIRQPWHIPSDTDSDIMEPPEQDKSELALPASSFLPSLPHSLPPSRTSELLYLDTAHFNVPRSHPFHWKHPRPGGVRWRMAWRGAAKLVNSKKEGKKSNKQGKQTDNRSVSRRQQSCKHNAENTCCYSLTEFVIC